LNGITQPYYGTDVRARYPDHMLHSCRDIFNIL